MPWEGERGPGPTLSSEWCCVHRLLVRIPYDTFAPDLLILGLHVAGLSPVLRECS